MELPLALAVFGALFIVSLLSADGRSPHSFIWGKPATTLSLLLVTGLPTAGQFTPPVVFGLLFSALGDAALLHEGRGSFLAGLFLFVVAHAAYTLAFFTGGGAAPIAYPAVLGGAIFGVLSLWLLVRLLPRVVPTLRIPVFFYAVAITLMVGAAYLVLAGPWPTAVGVAVAAGAVLFYVSDVILAWHRFFQPLPQGQTVNLAFYWLGQLGIALAARFLGET